MPFGTTTSFRRSFRAGERPFTITSASQLPNLEVWYNAESATASTFNSGVITSGTEITSWHNAGGLSSHDWNSTGGARPEWFSNIQNGKGVVRFNNTGSTPTGEDADTNERFTINPVTYINSLAGATMVVVYRSLSTSAGIRYVTSTDVGGFQWGQDGTQYIGGFSGATYTVDSQTVDTNFHYIIIRFDGSQTGNSNRLKARLDGADVTLTITGTVNAVTSASAAYFFGGCTGTGVNAVSNFFIGDIGELLIWTRALSTGEILAVEDYLSTKWAI
jgi:hypothetical protein